MPPHRSARTKRKICRCKPTCHKPLAKKTRQNHYRKLRVNQRRDRESSVSIAESQSPAQTDLTEANNELDDMGARDISEGSNMEEEQTEITYLPTIQYDPVNNHNSENKMITDISDGSSMEEEQPGNMYLPAPQGSPIDEHDIENEDTTESDSQERLASVQDSSSDRGPRDLSDDMSVKERQHENTYHSATLDSTADRDKVVILHEEGNENGYDTDDEDTDEKNMEEDTPEYKDNPAIGKSEAEEDSERGTNQEHLSDEEIGHEHLPDEETANEYNSDEEDQWTRYDEFEELGLITQEEKMKEIEDILELEKNIDEWKHRNDDLTKEDIDSIRAFKLKMISGMSDHVFNMLRFAFSEDMQILSLYRTLHRIAMLSRIVPIWIDCCPKSCMAYTGEYIENEHCPECGEARYREGESKPRRQFCYLPLIPRLQRFFTNKRCIEELSYRENYEFNPDAIGDVFDSEHYQTLCKTPVTVDGKELKHSYFSDKRDIAFTTCLDAYLLYKRKRGGPSATPILVQLYNLPPDIRTHLDRLLCVGVIPGPKGPKRLETFLDPFDDECATLAKGVPTFDCVEQCMFDLHAYNMFALGDIIAIEKFLKLKGHNSIFPCRSCKIKAVNYTEGHTKTYYVPLKSEHQEWDPCDLPPRKHDDWILATTSIRSATSQTHGKRIAQDLGIKGMPALTRVGSINFARGMPWDYMHLLLENVVKNLFNMWKGTFKWIDEGDEEYVIPEEDWITIGKETADANTSIPAAFVRRLGNPVEDQTTMTAEGWAFWFMYIAPIVLKGRFEKEEYYIHFMSLVSIMKRCIQFSITHDEIDTLETDIVNWVEMFEKIYYQYSPSRLAVCTLTIHGLLHIPDNIRFCGPMWTTWTFWMERYCGYLQMGLKSKVAPWANLNNRLVQKAHVEQIDIYYGLEDPFKRNRNFLSRDEHIPKGYPHTILRPPRMGTYVLEPRIRSKIAKYLTFVIGRTTAEILRKFPESAISWGKVRVANGGDLIRSSSASYNADKDRDMSYVRYEVDVEDGKKTIQREIFYGQLQRILEVELPEASFWRHYTGKTIVLAIITPCVTNGLDAAKTLTLYKRTTTEVVIDIQAISSVVGRVLSEGRWGIIDRSTDYARTEFIPENDEQLYD